MVMLDWQITLSVAVSSPHTRRAPENRNAAVGDE
jgi:hypothetical protein